MNQSIKTKNIVKTLTTTSIQLKATSTAVGFDTIMTLHHPPYPTHRPRIRPNSSSSTIRRRNVSNPNPAIITTLRSSKHLRIHGSPAHPYALSSLILRPPALQTVMTALQLAP